MKKQYKVIVTEIETENIIEERETGYIHDSWIKACMIQDVFLDKYSRDKYIVRIVEV